MDFFAAQENARRASRRLVAWFALAVAASIGVVYLALALMLAAEGETVGLWHPGLFVLTAVVVGGVILGGSAYKVAALAAGGGAAVAASLGGRLVERASTNPAERRLLNSVDEMAIAAGVPAPPVYVLDNELGINAFAAGARPSEAVVAVTQGALDKFTRDELQGVIAHEFSHILNGDMRLNLRLIGVLHGLFMLATAGRLLLRSGGVRSGKDRGGVVVLGLVLLVAGYSGVLAGRLIRAAVSRQREYLADAAAVQFTRNPAGVAGALRRIASESSTLASPRAEEVSHMLFDAGSSFSRWLATHPPLAERIRRIEGQAVDIPEIPVAGDEVMAVGFAAQIGTPAPTQIEAAHDLIETLPDNLRTAIATPIGARAVTLALLLSKNPEQRARQLDIVTAQADGAVARLATTLLPPTLSAGLRLPLIELALAALHELPATARAQHLAVADALVRADGRVTLTEYVLVRLLRNVLLPHAPPPFVVVPGELPRQCALLLSLVAHAGQRGDEVAAAFARGAALAPADHLALMPLAELRTEALDRALEILAAATPGFRRRLIEALAATAAHDGRIVPVEAELLTALCGALDCPVPLMATGAVPPAPTFITATPAVTDQRLFDADRLPLQALILANLIPIPGVLFFGWDARSLLLLYWLENLVIGGYTLLRMLRADGWRALGIGAFFLFHYGFFCGGHGAILMGLSSLGPEGVNDPLDPFYGEDWPVPLVPFQMMWAVFQWILHAQPGLLGLPLLGFVVSHGLSTVTHHFIGDEDAGRKADSIMGDPYRRIVVLHVALIAGSFAIILSGGGSVAPILLVLIALKIAFDIHQHRAVHRARQASVAPEAGRE